MSFPQLMEPWVQTEGGLGLDVNCGVVLCGRTGLTGCRGAGCLGSGQRLALVTALMQ